MDDTVSISEDAQDDIWHDDLLSRKAEARFLIDFLQNRVASRTERGEVGSFVLNIDARWGEGKTFFLERFCKQLEREGFLVSYVNGWRDDHTDDPLIAVLSAISTTLKPYLKSKELKSQFTAVKKNAGKVALAVGKGALSTLSKRYIGQALEDIVGDAANQENTALGDAVTRGLEEASKEIDAIADRATESLISHFERETSSIKEFRDNVAKLLETVSQDRTVHLPLFVVIDELDRCRPTYAVKLLERVKHMFETDNVVFVVATDTSQLRHSVAGIYGGEFDGRAYLQRFFDRTFKFRTRDTSEFVAFYATLWDDAKISYPTENLTTLLNSAIKHFRLDLRKFRQMMEIGEVVILSWPHAVKLETTLLIALSVMFLDEGDCNFNNKVAETEWLTDEFVYIGDHFSDKPRQRNRRRPLEISRVYSEYKETALVSVERGTRLDSSTPERQYVRERAGLEFNLRRTREEQYGPSVQLDLIDLIRSASQLS